MVCSTLKVRRGLQDSLTRLETVVSYVPRSLMERVFHRVSAATGGIQAQTLKVSELIWLPEPMMAGGFELDADQMCARPVGAFHILLNTMITFKVWSASLLSAIMSRLPTLRWLFDVVLLELKTFGPGAWR